MIKGNYSIFQSGPYFLIFLYVTTNDNNFFKIGPELSKSVAVTKHAVI